MKNYRVFFAWLRALFAARRVPEAPSLGVESLHPVTRVIHDLSVYDETDQYRVPVNAEISDHVARVVLEDGVGTREREIAGRLRVFYRQRPRPWLSPNARARALKRGRR